MSDGEQDPYVPHTVIDVGVVKHTASLILMCNYVRFYIEVDAVDLAADQLDCHIRGDFMTLCEEWEQLSEELEEWITAACFPAMCRLAPRPDIQRVFTLEEYFDPPTVYLRLKVIEGTLVAEEFNGDSSSQQYFQTRMRVADAERDVPEMKTLTQHQASKFTMARNLELEQFDYCEIPIRVREGREGRLFAFKAAWDNGHTLRELGIYSKLAEARSKVSIRMPELCGLIILDGELLGLVMEYIDNKGTMLYCAADASPAERDRWLRQIADAVRYLHTLDLSWGDVKPDNVLITTGGDAQIIDFGGGYHPDFIDRRLAGTKSGDLQGLDRLQAFLGC